MPRLDSHPGGSTRPWISDDFCALRGEGQILAAHFQDNDPTTGVVTRTMGLCPHPEVFVAFHTARAASR